MRGYIFVRPVGEAPSPSNTLPALLQQHLSSLSCRMNRPKLIPEKEYFFTHKRRQTFRAVFKRIIRAPGSDAADEFYYECEVDPALCGDQPPEAHEGGRATILLRPSLVTFIQHAPPDANPPRPVAPQKGIPPSLPPKENWVAETINSIRSVLRSRRRP